MASFRTLAPRDSDEASSDNIINKLLIVLLVLVLLTACSLAALWYLRRTRQAQKPGLPLHNAGKLSPRRSNHRRLSGITISSTIPLSRRASHQKIFATKEKPEIVETHSSPTPAQGLPQIRITLPEEVDPEGKRQSGREVVVQIGHPGNLDMESADEKLPPYTASEERFVSVDLDRVGGLQEKHSIPREPRP